MWLTIAFGIINAVMSFIGNRLIKFSGFDIAPSAVAILVWHGEHPLFAAVVLVLSYSLISPKELRYLWITLPVTILLAYLAGAIHSIYVLTIIYHIIGLVSAVVFQYFGAKYMVFILMNMATNFMVARVYGAF